MEGTDTWQVTLKHTVRIFEGYCDCPASENMDFCKHCVATALVYRQQSLQQGQLENSKAKDRLPAYLLTLDKKALAELIMELLQNDRPRLNELRIKADIAAGKMDNKAIKKQITSAIPYNRNLFHYPQLREYFHRVEVVINNIKPLIDELSAAKALVLIDYALVRIDRALETIDDSGGFRYDVLDTLMLMHLETLTRTAYTAEQLASYLYDLFNQPVYELYPKIPDAYAELLGEEGQQQFLSTVRDAWDKLPSLTSTDWDKKRLYSHLMEPLLDEAESNQNIEATITLYAKTANSFNDYLDLSERCLGNNQFDQALWWRKRAEKDTTQPYHAKAMLEDNQISLWLYSKDYSSISKILWQRFARMPSLKLYKEIKKIPEQESHPENQKKAIELIKQKINKDEKNRYQRQTATGTLAELYLYYQQPEEALDVAEQYGLGPELLIRVASANTQQPRRILPLIFRVARFYVDQSNNESYREAIENLHIGRKIIGSNNADQFASELKKLHVEYKRKRNFRQWLKEAFDDLL